MTAPLVASFGGGVNSAAMLVGMDERGIKPDAILFADTGGEKPDTYSYVAEMSAWCVAKFGIPVTTVKASDKTDPSLEANCLRLGTLPSIVYGGRTCSQRWKLQPCEKYLNSWQPAIQCWRAGEQIINAKGIDAGEPQRARDFSNKKYRTWYPLIDWKWRRRECVDAIRRAELPVPTKSACFFCPSSKKSEVVWLKRNHPDLFGRAVAMEENAAPKLSAIRGLGRHWSWADIAYADESQFEMFPETVETPCMCFDGESDEG